MAGNVKKFGFLKNPLSELGWDMLEKCMFLKWKFFQMLLKNFLRIVWPCSIYLEGCLRPYLYARKKIRVIRHVDQKILTKNHFTLRKKTVQTDFPGYHCNMLSSMTLDTLHKIFVCNRALKKLTAFLVWHLWDFLMSVHTQSEGAVLASQQAIVNVWTSKLNFSPFFEKDLLNEFASVTNTY